jgi:hypothetical protein
MNPWDIVGWQFVIIITLSFIGFIIVGLGGKK